MIGATEGLLADGTVVAIRPIQPADSDRLVRFHGRLSPETTRLRFFNHHPRLQDREVERFTNVDHVSRDALVAQLDDEIIGVARYDSAVGADEAEAAFVVEDRWQGTGVGTLLFDHLVGVARSRGIRRFTAVT